MIRAASTARWLGYSGCSRPLGRRSTTGLLLSLVVASLGFGCSGEHQGPGVSTDVRIPEPVVKAREERQTQARSDAGIGARKQILFGDLHVHTTFSPDAFMMSLPLMGGTGLHPPADACDFARLCADLDFWSINDHAEGISPRHWSETIDAIAECNTRAGRPDDPDSVAFLGWEWSQVGSTPDDHYGHKNVIFLETDRARVPERPIAAPRPEFRVAAIPFVGRLIFSLADFDKRELYADYAVYTEDVASVPECPSDVDSRELPLDCHEVAAHPRELHAKLDQWQTPSLVIPHGTSWGLMTPRGFSLARELDSGQHDPNRQRLFEIYSGHGSAEVYRSWPGAFATGEEALECPAPSREFLPCCWRAGEIIRERCEAEIASGGEGNSSALDCAGREREARRLYLQAGAAGHLSVPGADIDDWLDCDQCRDCFNPAFSHRPGGSAQAALALRRSTPSDDELAYRFGFIGSSDTHDARAGNGFKEFARLENTEALARSPLSRRLMERDEEPVARSREITLSEVPLAGRRDTERGASFLLTGGLAAVHAESRRRESIWSALESREVYATSGDRILLWFDLVNAPNGLAPMGAVVAGQTAAPIFRVSAVGAFEQKPGCPEFVGQALGADRLAELCLGECYNPAEERRRIDRLEMVRIRPQTAAHEPIEQRIDDPWRRFDCRDLGAGCRAEFVDRDFPELGSEVVYYARAIQAPTPAVNAGGFRCRYDADGNCVEISPCYTDERTSPEDDCLAENQEHAWSSPIFVSPGARLAGETGERDR